MRRSRSKVRNIAGIIVLMLLAIAFEVFIIYVHIENQKQAAEAQAREESHKEEEQEVKDQLTDLFVYIADNASFVVWGDDSAVSKDDGSAAAEFTSLVDEHLFQDLNYKISKLNDKGTYIDEAGINLVNMGVSNEGMREIMARSGASGIVTSNNFVMPADQTRSTIELKDGDGNELRFSEQASVVTGAVTIDGVEGQFYYGETYTYEGVQHVKFMFSRNESGKEKKCPDGTEVEIESASIYRDCIPIIYVNGSGIDSDPDSREFRDQIKAILETNSKYADDQYLVICSTSSVSYLDNYLKAEFGDHYIRYEVSSEDSSGYDDDEPADNTQLAEKMYNCLSDQGAFDKVKSAINKVSKSMDSLL